MVIPAPPPPAAVWVCQRRGCAGRHRAERLIPSLEAKLLFPTTLAEPPTWESPPSALWALILGRRGPGSLQGARLQRCSKRPAVL